MIAYSNTLTSWLLVKLTYIWIYRSCRISSWLYHIWSSEHSQSPGIPSYVTMQGKWQLHIGLGPKQGQWCHQLGYSCHRRRCTSWLSWSGCQYNRGWYTYPWGVQPGSIESNSRGCCSVQMSALASVRVCSCSSHYTGYVVGVNPVGKTCHRHVTISSPEHVINLRQTQCICNIQTHVCIT